MIASEVHTGFAFANRLQFLAPICSESKESKMCTPTSPRLSYDSSVGSIDRNSPPTEVILFDIEKKGLHVPYWVFILGVLIFVGVGVCLAFYFSRRRQPPSQVTNIIELQIIQVENSPRVLGSGENISVVTFGDTEGNLLYDQRNCPICLEDFDPQDRLMVFPSCRHAIHDKCAASFLTTSNSCPYCRHAIRSGV